MNFIVRIGIIYIVFFFLFVLIIGSYSSPQYLSEFSYKDWIAFTISMLLLIDVIFLWIYFLYNWGTQTFKQKSYKRIWFLIIFFGSIFWFIGILLYYVIVYEMKKGIDDNIADV